MVTEMREREAVLMPRRRAVREEGSGEVSRPWGVLVRLFQRRLGRRRGVEWEFWSRG
jgi:hypothetical protein